MRGQYTETTERAKVKAAYKSPFWGQKVDKMDDDQIVAVYMRLRLTGKIL